MALIIENPYRRQAGWMELNVDGLSRDIGVPLWDTVHSWFLFQAAGLQQIGVWSEALPTGETQTHVFIRDRHRGTTAQLQAFADVDQETMDRARLDLDHDGIRTLYMALRAEGHEDLPRDDFGPWRSWGGNA